MKKDNTKVEFILQGIKTEQFATFEENYAPKKQADLNTELQCKLDQKNMQVGVFIGFEFFQGKKIFLKIHVSCHFKLEEKSWNSFIIKNESKLVIPKKLLAHLAMITTGTARGVLFAKTEETTFSNFIVPTLNVAEMISEDAVFNIN